MRLKDLGNLSNVIKELKELGSVASLGELSNNVLTKSLDKLTASEILAKLATMGLTDAQKLEIVRLYATDAANYTTTASFTSLAASESTATLATGGLSTAFKGLGVSIASSTKAMWAFLTTTPEGWAVLAAAAVVGAVIAYSAFTVTLEEQKEKLEETKEAYDKITQELSELDSQITDVNKSIKELEAAPDLTWVKQEELERLREITKQLQLQKSLKQDEQLKASEDLFRENQKTYVKEFVGATGTDSIDDVTTGLSRGQFGLGQLDPRNSIVDLIASLQYLEEEKKKLTDPDEIVGIEEQIKDYADALEEYGTGYLTSLSSYKQNILEIAGIRELTADEQAFYASLDAMQKAVYEFYSPATWNNLELDSIFNTEGIEKSREEILQMERAGTLTIEELKKYPFLMGKINEADFLGTSTSNTQAFCDEMNAASKEMDDGIKVTQSGVQTYEELEKSAESYTDAFSAVRKSISSVNDAISEQAENGSLSADTMLSLVSAGFATALSFDSVTGACSLNTDALMELVQAKIQNQIHDLQILQNNIRDKLIGDGIAASTSAGGFYDLAKAKELSATADQLAAMEDYNDATAQQKALENTLKNYNKPDSGSSFPKAPSSSGSSDPLKDAFDKEYKTLRHNLELEYITEEEYYHSLEALNQKYFAGKEKYLDDYRKYEEEIYKGLQKVYKTYMEDQMNYLDAALGAARISYQEYSERVSEMLSSLYSEGKISAGDYFDYTRRMLEKQLGVYDSVLSAVTTRLDREIHSNQAIIDGIEQENDALEKQKDRYDKIISAVTDTIDTKNKEIQASIDALEKENDAISRKVDEYDSVLSAVQKVYEAKQEELKAGQDAIQERIDALREENDENKRAIELQKARYELERSMNQRSTMVYNGEQFVYMADTQAVRENQEKLDDLTLENTVASMEKEKEALQELIDELERYKNMWADIAGTFQTAKDAGIASSILGENFETEILQNRMEDIEAFRDRYVEAQARINDNSGLITSLEEKTLYYDSLKEKWNELSAIHEENISRQLADELFGSEWETLILEDRLLGFDEFKNTYLSIQDRIEDNTGLIESYNEKITYYQNLKNEWGSVADVYEDSVNAQHAAMMWGQNWEAEILSGRISNLNQYRKDYARIQESLAQIDVDRNNIQVEAARNAKNLAYTGNASISSGPDVNGGYNSADVNGGYNGAISGGKDDSFDEIDQYRVTDSKTGRVYIDGIESREAAGQWIGRQEESGRYAGSIIGRMKIEKYARGGVIPAASTRSAPGTGLRTIPSGGFRAVPAANSRVSPAAGAGAIPASGAKVNLTAGAKTVPASSFSLNDWIAQVCQEDHIIAVSARERVLTESQNKGFEKLVAMIPSLMADRYLLRDKQGFDFGELNQVQNNQPLSFTTGDIILNNVQNVDGLAKAIELSFPHAMMRRIQRR